MPANVTTTSGGAANLIRNHFEDILNEYLENTLLAADLLDSYVFPANKGTSVVFHRLAPFRKEPSGLSSASEVPGIGEVFGNPLVGNVTQLKGRSYVVDNIAATLRLIGNDMAISELDIMSSEPNPIPALSKLFLYNAADTLDYVYVNSLVSGASTPTSGDTQTATVPAANINGASVSVTTVWGDGSATLTEATLDADIPSHRIAAESFNTAEATIRAQSGKPRGDGLFHGLIAPQSAGDLRVDGTFQDIALRGTRKGEAKFERATIGEVFGVRVMVSENVGNGGVPGTVDATNDRIIRAPIVGMDYAKRISHARGVGRPSVRFIPPAHSAADIYGLVGFLVWKMYYAAVVSQPLAGVVLKTATTRGINRAQADDTAVI
jgi:hypothetical protein